MDHLPLPREPLLDLIEVPYRCTEPYDWGPTSSYPERHSWEVLYSPGTTMYLLNGYDPSKKALESLLQNWLYFGLLHEVFGQFSDLSEFVTENE